MENMCLNYENRCLGITGGHREKLPMLLVTGFLGSGKTTLLRHLLTNKSNLRIAVLVNEIGSIDIDGELLRSCDNNAGLGICTQELTNGCVCCNVRDDLRREVLKVLERRETVDYLVIETSGAADPRPVAASLNKLCRLDLVVTVVDATAISSQLETKLARQQISAADFILLNKVDLLGSEQAVSEVEREISKLSSAKIVKTEYGRVPIELLMDLHVETMGRGGDTDTGFMSHDGTGSQVLYSVGGHAHFHNKKLHAGFEDHTAHHEGQHHGGHDEQERSSIRTLALSLTGPVSLRKFQRFLYGDLLPEELGSNLVMRAKGLICFAECRRHKLELHVSGLQRVDVTHEGAWESTPKTKMVIIGSGFDHARMQAAFEACEARDEEQTLEEEEALVYLKDLIDADPMFEVIRDEDGAARATGGAIVVSFIETTDMKLHGVYSDDLNKELISLFNSLRTNFLAVPSTRTKCKGTDILLASPATKQEAKHLAEELHKSGRRIIDAKAISGCKCGF
uniref:CobW C-terminal domain-containing protein n=1 Tax=Guillardia theta TaxID=55529 RepID=A0A7S4KCG2_GUITH